MDVELLRHLTDAALRQEARRRGLDPEELDRAALIEAISRCPPEPQPAEEPPEEESEGEPIKTRTMAELLLGQGHVERALRILEELARKGRDPGVLSLLARARDEHVARSMAKDAKKILRGRVGALLEIVGRPPSYGVVWRASAEGKERARALVGEGVLVLRVVRVSAARDRSVETRATDALVADEGFTAVDSGAGRLVVSLGIRGAGGFASIAHRTA